LLTASDYQRVFKRGRKYRGEYFTLISCANDCAHARLGLAIAKRFVPLAVDRNRIRRIIRESFRLYQGVLIGLDIVVLGQKELQSIPNSALYEDLHRQWRLMSPPLC